MTNLIKNLEWYLLKVEGGTRNLQNQLYMRYIAAPALESNRKEICRYVLIISKLKELLTHSL